jgi:cytochrome c oxidase subunit 1
MILGGNFLYRVGRYGTMVQPQLAVTVVMILFLLSIVVWLSRIEDWRSYTPLAGGGSAVGGETEYAHEEKPSGILRWLTTVDHKDIGILYGTFAVIAFTPLSTPPTELKTCF